MPADQRFRGLEVDVSERLSEPRIVPARLGCAHPAARRSRSGNGAGPVNSMSLKAVADPPKAKSGAARTGVGASRHGGAGRVPGHDYDITDDRRTTRGGLAIPDLSKLANCCGGTGRLK